MRQLKLNRVQIVGFVREEVRNYLFWLSIYMPQSYINSISNM
jgi:hypothetical protein